MYKETVLAIDIGTQSLRALAFDLKGGLIDSARVVYSAPYYSREPGWAEQDPDYYWQCLADACRQLFSGGRVSPDSLAALSITSQRSTLVNLGKDGRPLRPAIVWLDQRRARSLPRVGGLWQMIFKLSGLNGTLHYLQAEAEVNWLRENQPDLWEKTEHYLFISGYLTYLLTGRFVDSTGCQVGYIPFDYRKQAWAPPSHWKWRALPIRPETLPDLEFPGRKMGEVTAEAARLTGLPEGLPVIAGASDKACEVLGSGCLEQHQACVGYGTTATINVNSRKYIEPIPLIPPYPSACPGAYNLEVQIFRGFWMVTWFKEEFAWQEQAMARQEGVAAEELLDRLVADIPPGSMGLMLQPYWSPGLRHPGLEARGGVIGFRGGHTRGHLYRAILEGLAFAIREGRERIERRTGVGVSQLFVCGGGSRSDQMMQITADVFGIPAVRPATYEASGLGASILAALGSGLHSDLKTAVGEMTRVSSSFDPLPERSAVYDSLYRKVYARMYRRLRPLYREIHRLSGQPDY